MPWSFHTRIGESAREGIHFSVPETNPISRKRDESVSMMSFPGGPRTLPKRDKREFYSHCNADWLNINFWFDSVIHIIE